jgi:hypothetical protein
MVNFDEGETSNEAGKREREDVSARGVEEVRDHEAEDRGLRGRISDKHNLRSYS